MNDQDAGYMTSREWIATLLGLGIVITAAAVLDTIHRDGGMDAVGAMVAAGSVIGLAMFTTRILSRKTALVSVGSRKREPLRAYAD